MSEEKNDSKNLVKEKFKNLESLLKKDFGENVCVLSCTFDNLVPLGDNFASDILKINVKLRRTENSPVEDLNFVAKTILTEDENEIDWTWLINKEISMYTEIFPFYSRVEKENNIINNMNPIINLIPKFYGYRLSLDPKAKKADENSVILLENIREKGYYNMSKKIGLDLKHATLAAATLARFHALGIASKKQHPQVFAKNLPFATRLGMPYEGGVVIQDNIIALIKDDPRFSKYADVVQQMADRRKINRNFEMVTNETWSTICHNDFWTTNIMFHNDSETGNIDQIKIIDFQTYCFANVTVDLPYFLCGSLDDDTKFNHFDDLLDTYHKSLVAELEKMNVGTDDYSRDKFDEQLGKDAPYEFLHCAMALLFFTIETDQATDHTDIINRVFNSRGNELFFRKLQELFYIYEKKGWLH